MTAPTAQQIMQEYEFTTMLVHHLVEGLTQVETLLQLPFDVNCLNWVLGHIIVNRSHGLEAVGVEHAWQDQARALYHTGTANITPGSQPLTVVTLLACLDEGLAQLKARLETVSEAYLSERFNNYRGEKTRAAHLSGFHWHETYHIGQLEIFRALALSKRDSQQV